MAYNLERFGTLTLPFLNPQFQVDTVPARNTIVRTTHGGYDVAGSGQAEQDLPQPISYKGFIVDRDLTAWRAAVDAMRAMSRKRDKLWRRTCDTNEVQWCWARFLVAQTDRDFQRPLEYQASIRFLQQTPWVGHEHTSWVLDEGDFLDTGLYLDDARLIYTLDVSPKVITITNGGNRATSNVRLAITAGTTAITSITFACGGAEFTFSGTVAAGHILIIDSGLQSVTNDGIAAYANFTLTSNHIIDEWLVFEPGANTLTVTKTGGSTNSVLTVAFADGWE